MSLHKDHLEKARYNESLADHMFAYPSDRAPYDWIVTMYFYSALHYIDAYLDIVAGVHPLTHNNREDYLNPLEAHSAIIKVSQEIFNNFKALKNKSVNARYMQFCDGSKQTSYKNIQRKFCEDAIEKFKVIKAFVEAAIPPEKSSDKESGK